MEPRRLERVAYLVSRKLLQYFGSVLFRVIFITML